MEESSLLTDRCVPSGKDETDSDGNVIFKVSAELCCGCTFLALTSVQVESRIAVTEPLLDTNLNPEQLVVCQRRGLVFLMTVLKNVSVFISLTFH